MLLSYNYRLLHFITILKRFSNSNNSIGTAPKKKKEEFIEKFTIIFKTNEYNCMGKKCEIKISHIHPNWRDKDAICILICKLSVSIKDDTTNKN